MMLFIGSDIPLPIIPFKENAPGFHTAVLKENQNVLKHFSSKYVFYAGSSEGCGCGFRHALLENDNTWLNVVDDEDGNDFKSNMRELYEYVRDIIIKGGKVELYACWDGDFKDDALSKADIPFQELINKDFYLKEKGFYHLY